jgi:hypothetical protein
MPLARIPQIIEGSARVAGLAVEVTFVQQAARDAATDDALPLLALTVRELLEWPSNKISNPGRLPGARRQEGGSHPRSKTRCAKPPTGCWPRRSRLMTGWRHCARRSVHTGCFNAAASIGSFRTRLPVAAKIALATAGTIADVPGSPIPPGGSELWTIWTSIAGASLMRSIW